MSSTELRSAGCEQTLSPPAPVCLAEALSYWLSPVFVCSGSPAGQISMLHQQWKLGGRQPIPIMSHRQILFRSERNDTRGINLNVAVVVVALDMIKIDRVGYTGPLV